jgi:hypothetical protein
MMFWWLVVGVLVVATILLTMLLAPLPSALHAAVVGLIDKIQRPLWVVLSVMAWVLFGTAASRFIFSICHRILILVFFN